MRRRTLKKYQTLYYDPTTLFPGDPSYCGSQPVETILFPNGENEIWFKSSDGLGFKIVVSDGPHGLGIRVNRFIGTPKITISLNPNPDSGIVAETEIELTQYRNTPRARAFKRWYNHEETPDDIILLGAGFQRGTKTEEEEGQK